MLGDSSGRAKGAAKETAKHYAPPSTPASNLMSPHHAVHFAPNTTIQVGQEFVHCPKRHLGGVLRPG